MNTRAPDTSSPSAFFTVPVKTEAAASTIKADRTSSDISIKAPRLTHDDATGKGVSSDSINTPQVEYAGLLDGCIDTFFTVSTNQDICKYQKQPFRDLIAADLSHCWRLRSLSKRRLTPRVGG
jgi:hypothetical protein